MANGAISVSLMKPSLRLGFSTAEGVAVAAGLATGAEVVSEPQEVISDAAAKLMARRAMKTNLLCM